MKSRSTHSRRVLDPAFLEATRVLAAALLLTPAALAAQEDPPPELTPKQVLRKVDRQLMSYATADARAGLDSIFAEEEPAHVLAHGRILEQEKSYDEAILELRKAARGLPNEPAPWIYLGDAHVRADHPEEAEQSFRKARNLAQASLDATPEGDEEDPQVLYELGRALRRLKDYDKAATQLNRARELDPEHQMALFELGTTRALQERWEDAITLLTELIETNPRIAYAFYYRGLAAAQTPDRKDLLINDFDRFVAAAPEAPEAARAQRILERLRR